MKNIKDKLEKSIEDIMYYDQSNAVESVEQTVFESILKHERDEFVSLQPENKGNGYYTRLAKSVNQYFRLQVPRDRLGLFKPVFLEAIKAQDAQMQDMAFKLYVKGLTTQDISEIFDEVYGKKLSPSSISSITKDFEKSRDGWLQKPLQEHYYCLYIDALYIPIRRDYVSKEAFYIILGLNQDLKREVLGVFNIPSESASGWNDTFIDLKKRGLKQALLVISDGLPGIKEVIHHHFPKAHVQQCLVHKIRDLLLHARSKDKSQISLDFKQTFILENPTISFKDIDQKLTDFLNKWGPIYPSFRKKLLSQDIHYYTAYLNFPHSIHRMIYTTNWIERLNKSIKRTTKIRNAFPSPNSALTLISAALMDIESSTYNFPVTAFLPAQPFFENLLAELIF